ncbi:MAG: hypothetical protein M1818_005311 [Claussenomyces sp. TS43310]|nr:MAG: hypothetical protein M1818_005311 [Claussenomyces sp. TS43310]
MMKGRPQSRSSSKNVELLQNGFQYLIQHNANTSFPRKGFSYDDGDQLQSTPVSSYGSSPPGYGEGLPHGTQQSVYTFPNESQGKGLGISYDSYPPYLQDSGQYPILPNDHPAYHDQYATSAGSPPTPSMPTPGSDAIRTRSGLTINRHPRSQPESKSKVSKSPKPKKTRKGKAKSENKMAKLDRPLSVLTKDWVHVPIVDIEAYVNRPAEERHREVEEAKIPGKVKRPMNSFMLYRKAYQLRTKNWCLENNHQVVSQVCGDSWPLEPEELRAQFNEWAKIERANHQSAHPGYKFTPSKPGVSKARREYSADIESEVSDLDDYDWQQGQTRRPKRKQNPSPRPVKAGQHQGKRSPYGLSRQNSTGPVNESYNRSSYQVNNPGRPLPAPYDQTNLQNGQYYQQTVHKSFTVPGAEDVVIKKTATPGLHFLGLPQNQGFETPDHYQSHQGYAPPEQVLHPLFGVLETKIFENGYPEGDALYYGSSIGADPQWDSPYNVIDPELQDGPFSYMSPPEQYNTLQIHDQHMQRLNNSQEGWKIETLDAGQDFEKWMDED